MSRQGLIICALATAIASTQFGGARAADMAPASQVSNLDGVKITVEPRGFPIGAKTWDFAITLETHTRPLDDDLVNAAMLFADGKPYRPLAWEGAPPGGHHRKGELRFDVVAPLPKVVELHVRLTGEARPRIFRWQPRP